MNCEEPAKTRADMAAAPQAESPEAIANAPKISPKGAAPTSKGKVSRMPAIRAARAEDLSLSISLCILGKRILSAVEQASEAVLLAKLL